MANPKHERRVVVTGMGWVTSLGHNVSEVWDKLVAGTSGITALTKFDVSEFPTKIGGEIKDWQGGVNLDHRDTKRMDKFAQYAMHGAIDAVKESGIDFSKEDPFRCGSIVGSGVGGIEEFAEGHGKFLNKGPLRVSPFMVPKLMCNAASGNIAIHYNIMGPNAAVATACASAAHAIGDAVNAIRNDDADVMITGGSEAAVTPLGLACFVALKALSKRNDDPAAASRPFDKGRDGFILAEGAGIMVVEEYEHAKARGANIIAEFLGWGQSADGSHITAPDEEGRGAAYAMQRALKDAAKNTDDISYINAHGTSTGLGDVAETRAIKRLFNGEAVKTPVSSTKSMTGHSLGASGGIEAIVAVKTIQTGILPPTINLEDPEDECDLDYVPNTAREAKVETAMSNSFGFGGHNVALVFGKI